MDIMIKHVLRDARVQALIGGLGLLAVISGGWLLYKNYRLNVNERAQLAFAMQWDQFAKAMQQSAVAAQDWEAIEAGFAQAYREHGSSDIAPFYLAFQADAALQAHKHQEALSLMEEAVKGMWHFDSGYSRPNSIYYLYNIKLNVMRLGSADGSVRAMGEKELRALAEDSNNSYQGLAWYQLWHHAWVAGDHAAAQAAYEKLVACQGQDAQWASLAQAKMQFLA